MLDFNRDIAPYLRLGADKRPSAQLRHTFYTASIDHRDHLRRVFRKSYPIYLDLNRPKEQKQSKAYRKLIYRNPFRGMKTRLIETLDHIRQADDFAVVFPDDQRRSQQAADTLQAYVEQGFSGDGSALDWFWKRVRPLYVNDPNAVMLVLPAEQPLSDTQRVEPRAFLIPCENVYQHRRGKFAVLELTERSTVTYADKRIKEDGRILVFIDHETYAIARQVGEEKVQETGKLNYTWEITGLQEIVTEDGRQALSFRPPLHGCPEMPAVKLGKQQQDEAEESRTGQVERLKRYESEDPLEEFYESVLSDSLPHIETAQQIENDLAVERNFHVSSQEWRYITKRCPDEKHTENPCIGGFKTVRGADDHLSGLVKCTTCQGTGMDHSGSGTEIIGVTPPSATTIQDEGRPTNLPIPPGGFIPRSIEPLTKFVEEYKRQKAEAYATINMQFLEVTPTDQSGTSKRYDRQELYRELNTQGVHLCGLLRKLYQWVAVQRYGNDEQVPAVLEPVRFDLENAELTRAELVEAKDKQFDPNLIAPLEKKLIEYQAGTDSDYYRRYELKERFDPYPNRSDEEKLFLLASAKIVNSPGSEQLQAIIERIMLSINWDGLVNDCVRTVPGFWELDPVKQYEKLVEMNTGLVSKQEAPAVDPVTGKPLTALAPLVDFKNYNQV